MCKSYLSLGNSLGLFNCNKPCEIFSNVLAASDIRAVVLCDVTTSGYTNCIVFFRFYYVPFSLSSSREGLTPFAHMVGRMKT